MKKKKLKKRKGKGGFHLDKSQNSLAPHQFLWPRNTCNCSRKLINRKHLCLHCPNINWYAKTMIKYRRFGNPTLISGFIKSWLHSLQIVEVCKTREIKKYWRHRKTTSSAKVKWLCSCFIWSTFLSIVLIHAAQSAFPIVNLQVAIIFIHSQIQMLFFKQQNKKKTKKTPQTSDNPPHLFQ